MIRTADAAAIVSLPPVTEAALRIGAAVSVYGAERPFCRFWTDENGGALMIAEGVATLACAALTEEWITFLTMSPDVHTVRTDGAAARALAARWGADCACGAVMRAAPIIPCGEAVTAPPKDLYPLIREVFGQAVPPFDGWYADVHHRLRRGRFRARAVYDGEQVLSCAMTVAEREEAVLLGAVATHPAARGRGLASHCVTALTAEYQEEGKTVYISPKNEGAQALYTRLGFAVCGEWGTVVRKE